MNTATLRFDMEYLRLLEDQLAEMKQKSYTHMNIELGHTVLDVGCGPATDTVHLAQLVGQSGKVMGLDNDQGLIDVANRRAIEDGVNGWVEHKRGDATALPFSDGTFDSCRSERLFQHLPFPECALSEMSRVTKPNGRVVVLVRSLSIHLCLLSSGALFNSLMRIGSAMPIPVVDCLNCFNPRGSRIFRLRSCLIKLLTTHFVVR